MKKETILDLYYGKLNPLEIPGLEEYRHASADSLQAAEDFAKKLPQELRAEFARLWELEQKADEQLHQDGFLKGFSTGLRLAAEAFAE